MDDSERVSRETVLGSLEAKQGAKLRAYVESLSTEAELRGLIGPREVPRLWERHILNCAISALSPDLSAYVPMGATVADVGSGAGLPGIVWAIVRPDLQVTLIEPLLRRTDYLNLVTAELSLDNVTVIRARAEQVDQKFACVTARAVAALDTLVRNTEHLRSRDGNLLFLKGDRAQTEVDDAQGLLRRKGLAAEIIQVSLPKDPAGTESNVVRVGLR